MKKLIATTLACAMMFSLAACSSKKAPEQTTTAAATTETTAAPSNAPTEPSSTATTVNNPAFEFIKTKVDKITVAGGVDEDGEKEEDEVLSYYVPELLIKSSYAESVNKEINSAYEKYKKNLKNEELEQFHGTSFIANLTKDGILSLVFIAYGEYEQNEFKVYNIDTKTGEKVDNARIAQIAGVSNIRKAAMDALQAFYNKKEWYEIKNYKVVKEKGEKKDSEDKEVEKRFSEKHLNDKMKIGLTSEGKLLFVSNIYNGGGAAEFDFVYDADGNDLDDEKNPCWVGESYPDDEDDEDEGEEDEDYDDAYPPFVDDDE